MYRKLMALLLSAALLMTTADAKDYIRWVDFDVPTEALTTAMHFDIDSQGQELELDWIEILALAATRNGSGKLSSSQVKKAAEDLRTGQPISEILKGQTKYYDYYYEAYEAVLGGLLGSYAIRAPEGEWKATYGLKAFCPVAAGWGFSHCQDFGNSRSFGFARKHLGQ